MDPIECCEDGWYDAKELKAILEREKKYLKEVLAKNADSDFYRAVIKGPTAKKTKAAT